MITKESNILIIGLGLIGGSFAKGLSEKGYRVFGYDINEKSMNYAENNGFIQKDNSSLENKIASSDLIIFGLYPKLIKNYVQKYQHLFKDDVLLTDVTGTKTSLYNEVMSVLDNKYAYISSHPMAGREKEGIEYSNTEMFKNANFIVIPFNNDERINEIKLLGKELGFLNIEVMKKEYHDEVIGYLSQLTHAIAIALMNARDCTSMIKYTGDSFKDLTRIASINDKLWSELFFENKDVLISEIDQFQHALNKIKETLVNEDKETLINEMKESTYRRGLFNK